jgi:hypothetical protein
MCVRVHACALLGNLLLELNHVAIDQLAYLGFGQLALLKVEVEQFVRDGLVVRIVQLCQCISTDATQHASV